MKNRLLFLLRCYATTVLVFIVAKVVFMLCNHEGHAFGVTDVWQVVWHGLSLDLSTALYFLILPLLATIAAVWVKVPPIILKVYFGLVATAFALAFVSDTSLYPFWGFKLDASCLQYLDTPTEAMASVSAGYLLLRLVLTIAVAVIIYRLLPSSPYGGDKRGALLVPNSSIMKAGCFSEIANHYGVSPLSDNSHLFISDHFIEGFPGRQFQIEAISSMNKRDLRSTFAGIQQANVAVRNFPMTAEQLRQRLHLRDGGEHYVFATTDHNGQHILFLCKKT